MTHSKNERKNAMKTSPVCRCSFANTVISSAAKDSTKYAWQITLLLDKKDKEHMDWIKNTLNPAYKELLATKFPDESKRPKIPLTGHQKSPLKDADVDTDGSGTIHSDKYPELKGHYILRIAEQDIVKSKAAKSGQDVSNMITKYRHRVVGQDPKIAITDDDEIYSGCWVRVSCNFYWRKVPTNPGVSAGFVGVQKIRDDEPFGAMVPKAEDMFDKMGADDPMNYQDDPFNPPPASGGFDDGIPY